MGHTAVSTIKVSSVTLWIWQHGAKRITEILHLSTGYSIQKLVLSKGTKYIKHWLENES